MRRNWRAGLIETVGSDRLKEIWEGVQDIWSETLVVFRRDHLRDGHALTAYRSERLFTFLKGVCDRDPLLFPAFDYDRRRARALALIESGTTILTAAVTRTRSEWIPAAMRRFENGRQLSFLMPIVRSNDPLTALLMIVNGAPMPRRFRERPIATIIRRVDGSLYSGDILNLDTMFARSRVVSVTPIRLHIPKTPGVAREIIKRTKLTNLKSDFTKEKEGS